MRKDITRIEGTSVRVIRMLGQLVATFQVERANVKFIKKCVSSANDSRSDSLCNKASVAAIKKNNHKRNAKIRGIVFQKITS